ncbi:MAG: hypothetical protein WBQ25_25235 [Nitrososphaeraceae archaeon]
MKAAIIPKDYDEDGDVHFNVIPDPKLQDLLNLQSGDEMVVEVICWNKPSTSYNQQWGNYCNGVESRSHFPTLLILKAGDHVRITGKWVQDIGYPKPDHAQWNEIHPAEKIEKIP